MDNFKLRVKINGQEFEAEGPRDTVCRQFEMFTSIIRSQPVKLPFDVIGDNKTQFHPESAFASPFSHPPSQNQEMSEALKKVIQEIPRPPYLVCRVVPSGSQKEADRVLILLLGFRFLRREKEVAVLRVNQSVKQSGGSPARLDRVLGSYARRNLVLKSGKGKGGYYQLTTSGIQHATEKVMEIVKLLA